MSDHFLKHISTKLSAADFVSVMGDYGDVVWNYAYFLTKKNELADDISQDTFERAFRYLHTFRGQCSLKTWLLKITRNTWYSYRRSAFVRKVTLVDFFSPQNAQRSAEEEYLDAESTHDIWAAVLQLPRKYREVLLLQVHYELTTQEMSSTLGVTVNAVKSRLRRAKKMALEYLKRKGELNG